MTKKRGRRNRKKMSQEEHIGSNQSSSTTEINNLSDDVSLQNGTSSVSNFLVSHYSSSETTKNAETKNHQSDVSEKPRQDENSQLPVKSCSTFCVKNSDIMGRYMVATKILKPGDVILSESPLVVGPCFGCEVMCLGCYKILRENEHYVKCKICSWPLCDTNCAGVNTNFGHSEIECTTLAECKSGRLLEYDDFSKLRLQFHSIMPFRCLLLKTSNVKAHDILMTMESHKEIRNSIPEIWQDSQITANRIRKDWNLTCYQEDEIHNMCGILGVNAFELGHNGINLRGVYPTASMMSHDCVANTNHVDEHNGFKLTVRASIKIYTDQPITVNYINPLQGTTKRREELLDNKYFECVCERCSDPTELGTHSSTLLCPKCKKGFILPQNSLDHNSNWICNNSTSCQGYEVEARVIRKLIDKISEEVEVFDSNDIPGRETFLQKYRNVLHPTHYLYLAVKISLSQLYGKIHGYLINDLSEDVLKRKKEICKEVLKILDVIEPGFTRIRGVTLYELHAPIMVLTTKAYESGNISKPKLRRKLKKIHNYLQTSATILKHEPENSYENLMYCGAINALERIKDWEKIIGKLN